MAEARRKLELVRKTRARRVGSKGTSPAGVDLIRQAVDKAVGAMSTEIANALVDKAIKGDVSSVRLLYSIATEQPHVEIDKEPRSLWSRAAELAAEPPWSGETSESAGETYGGSREPEGQVNSRFI